MTPKVSKTINPAGPATIHAATPSGAAVSGGEFSRFVDLAGKLVAVPKAEVDAKRRAAKA